MEHSLIKGYTIKTDSRHAQIIVTAVRMINDMNGNPRYKVQVWVQKIASDNELYYEGNIWSPKVKGYRRSKDDTYVLKGVYNLRESMNQFVKVFEESINE